MPERCCLSRRGKQYREKSRLFPGLFPGLFPRVFPRVFPGYFPDGFPKDFPAGLSGEPRRLPGRSPIKFPISAPAPQKPPQANGPCSWAVRRLPAPPPCQKRNAAPPPPARGVGVCRIRAEGTGRRPCRPGLAGKGGEAGADAFVDAAGHALHVGVFFVFRLLVRGDGEVDQGFFVLLPVQQHQPE